MSQPIKHSPGPWRVAADGMTVNDKDGYGVVGVWEISVFEALTPNNLQLIAAAPTMYHILRAILDPNKAISAVGVIDAAIVLGELEGENEPTN